MPNDPAFVDHVLELLARGEVVTAKKMFGGHGLFREGLMFGLISDSTLYLKVDDHNRGEFESQDLEPFVYFKGGQPMSMSYYRAPEETLEDPDAMAAWAESAFQAAIRSRKPAKTKRR